MPSTSRKLIGSSPADPRRWLERLWASLVLRASGPSAPSGAVVQPLDRVTRLAEALLSERGEASGAVVARELHEGRRALDDEDRLAFQRLLATHFQPDEPTNRDGLN